MRLFKQGTLNVIFLVPIAIYASQNGGYATTQEARPGPLNKQQIEETVAGNTLKLADDEVYALMAKDGNLKGRNLPNGATEGSWRVSDNDVLCASWDTPKGPVEVCDALGFFSAEIGYQWGGNTMVLLEGNPKNLQTSNEAAA